MGGSPIIWGAVLGLTICGLFRTYSLRTGGHTATSQAALNVEEQSAAQHVTVVPRLTQHPNSINHTVVSSPLTILADSNSNSSYL